MTYVSNLVGRPVADVDGEPVGRLRDVVAVQRGEKPYPQVVAIVVAGPGAPLTIPLADVAVLVAPAIPLTRRLSEIVPHEAGPNDLYLMRDVMDKQIIDTDGIRVVRVNDLELARVGSLFFVANVDIGGLGLLRRLGLERVARQATARLGREVLPGVISWEDVELLPGHQQMRLKVPGAKLAELYPADLAEIISDLSPSASSNLLNSLDLKTVADTLEEVEPEFQASLVEAMSDEKVADVLEEMAPDEAADLLAELPDDRSEELLNLMEEEEAADVRKLLAYPEDSAGGIMNTEFVAVRAGLSTGEAIALLREMSPEAETIYYVYVTDEQHHLMGVLSLRDLVLSAPSTPVTDIMMRRVVSANVADSQDEVAQTVAKYNLLAVPVVDDQGTIQGIVTADDALDKIIPTAWKKRLPRWYR